MCSGGTTQGKGTYLRSEIYTADVFLFFLTMRGNMPVFPFCD